MAQSKLKSPSKNVSSRQIRTARPIESGRNVSIAESGENFERFQTTLDGMNDFIHVIDANLNVILYNKALSQELIKFDLEGDISGKYSKHFFKESCI